MIIRKRSYLAIKRIMSIVLSLIGISFCLAFVWWWVFVINFFVTGGSPLFIQKRYGKNKKIFKIIKFRTMKKNANQYLPPNKIDGNTYFLMETKFGIFLRKTSIDETPQLINVLFGNMSIIGPRPGLAFNEDELVYEREKFSPNAYEVRPGITGYAQIVMERKHDPIEKATLDSFYVKNICFSLDCKIFCLTILKLFR